MLLAGGAELVLGLAPVLAVVAALSPLRAGPRLADVAAEAAKLDEPVLVATLRQLVQAVIVHAPPGTDELAIEIKASLSELTLPGSSLKRSSGGVDRW